MQWVIAGLPLHTKIIFQLQIHQFYRLNTQFYKDDWETLEVKKITSNYVAPCVRSLYIVCLIAACVTAAHLRFVRSFDDSRLHDWFVYSTHSSFISNIYVDADPICRLLNISIDNETDTLLYKGLLWLFISEIDAIFSVVPLVVPIFVNIMWICLQIREL